MIKLELSSSIQKNYVMLFVSTLYQKAYEINTSNYLWCYATFDHFVEMILTRFLHCKVII